jgi:hypothetical protein
MKKGKQMKNTSSSALHGNTFSTWMVPLLLFVVLVTMADAQVTSDNREAGSGGTDASVIVVDVWADGSFSTSAPDGAGPRLSREFAMSGLASVTALREWQQHLAHTIRNGYPVAEYWIETDRERAADSLRVASLTVSAASDRTALQELAVHYEDLRRWSSQIVEANRKVELGKYYMSARALDDDALFQKATKCARFLAPMFASGRLGEDPACQ